MVDEMTGNHRAGEIEALRALLEVHGSDRTRWPAPSRLRFAPLLAADPEARGLLAEAEALDALLDEAPRGTAAAEEVLAERIVAAALSEGRGAASASVRAFPHATARAVVLPGRRQGGVQRRAVTRAAALLAASLLIGIVTGGTGLLDAIGVYGSGGAASTEWASLSLEDEAGGFLDEDLL